MFKVQRIECNPLQENCYVVSDDTKECVIIDCGAMSAEELAAIDSYIRQQQLTPVHLLATHGHLDHNFGNAYLFQKYGLKVDICAEDQELVEHLPDQARDIFGIEIPADQPPVGRLLSNGDVITFGQHRLQVLQSPGHTHGSCLFYCAEEKTVFTGDTLFRMSIGRTDFAEGSWTQMEQSLRNVVAKLPADTKVLSGHGPQSSIADELQYNPYLRF
jgi:glyoxylase-like metal-dependent hydrolase (beta-lactamase superfamily II)